MQPKMQRFLAKSVSRVGLGPCLRSCVRFFLTGHFIDGPTDRELGNLKLDYVQTAYGYPHMVGHRSELAKAIFDGCKREKSIQFFFSTAADQVDVSSDKPSFVAVPRQGGQPRKIETDILLGADGILNPMGYRASFADLVSLGIKSKTRASLLQNLGVRAEVEDTGQACYRIMIKREDLAHDPDLLELLDGDRATRWVGEHKMIIGYPVSNKTIFNISTAQPDVNFAAAPSATYTTRGSKSTMLSVYSGFCPKIQRLLKLVPEGEVCEWKLRVHQPLPTWFHRSTALVGDACHPTQPHLAQGAAQAIEDAAVLGVVLSRLPDSSPNAIEKAFKVYEKVRKSRAEILVNLAAITGVQLRLGEGAAKEERNKMLASLKDKKGESPDKWADQNTQKMTYGHDCMQVTNEELNKMLQVESLSL